ncbi:hypothetical protein ACFWYW_44875 [Nonomuraea sp. NPDC059023]|uniref:hypothetical protein n=1 Tax=unclassified Nonomuraea TaxID=2593643 RepID=UPI00367B8C7A
METVTLNGRSASTSWPSSSTPPGASVCLAPSPSRHALAEYEKFSNEHRAHQTLDQAAPRRVAPDPITEPARIIHLNIRRHDRLGGILREYSHAA